MQLRHSLPHPPPECVRIINKNVSQLGTFKTTTFPNHSALSTRTFSQPEHSLTMTSPESDQSLPLLSHTVASACRSVVPPFVLVVPPFSLTIEMLRSRYVASGSRSCSLAAPFQILSDPKHASSCYLLRLKNPLSPPRAICPLRKILPPPPSLRTTPLSPSFLTFLTRRALQASAAALFSPHYQIPPDCQAWLSALALVCQVCCPEQTMRVGRGGERECRAERGASSCEEVGRE